MYDHDQFWALTDAGPREDIHRCWNWQGRRDNRGRPVWKGQRAQRVALWLSGVAADSRQDGRHTCGNPSCVSPFHTHVTDHRDGARLSAAARIALAAD